MAKSISKKTTKNKLASRPSHGKAKVPAKSAKLAGKPARKALPPAKVSAPVVSKSKPSKPSKAAVKLAAKRPARPAAVASKAKPVQPTPVVPLQVPLKSVASGAKLAKNQAGLKTKELEYYRGLLLAKRRELLGDVFSMEEEALRSGTGTNLSNLPIHMADMGTDNYEQEFTLGLVQKDRDLLREINMALAKLRDGTYGICEGTGKPISKPRLEAKPWAKYTIEHARKLEKSGMRA